MSFVTSIIVRATREALKLLLMETLILVELKSYCLPRALSSSLPLPLSLFTAYARQILTIPGQSF